MATTISLVVGGDFISDVSTLDLTGYNAGFNVAQDGFLQNLEGGEENIILRARRSTQDLVATDLVSLAATYIEKCRLQNQTAERYQVFLRAKADSETSARQAVLTYLEWAGKLAAYDYMFRVNKNLSEIALMMTRGRWESTAARTVTLLDISGLGGHTSAGLTSGDFPSRVGYTMLMPHSGSGVLTEYWWGFRTARFGTLANFVSPWECELGSALTDTAVATDVTASPGGGGNTKLTCTFATVATMASRFTLTPYQISNANYEDLRGTFNLVARIKCGTGITARVRLAYGFGSTLTYNDGVIVTGTDWKLYDLGRVTLPAGGQVSSLYSAMKSSVIQFEAQRTAGSNAGGVQVDCFIPIPVNEGYAHISGGTGVKNELLVNPLNKITCFDYTSTAITGLASTTGTNPADYVLPIGTGIIVVAAQRAAISVLADAVDVTLKAFARWRTLSGATILPDQTFTFVADEEGWVYATGGTGGTGAWSLGELLMDGLGTYAFSVTNWISKYDSTFTAYIIGSVAYPVMLINYSDSTYDQKIVTANGTNVLTVSAGNVGKTVVSFQVRCATSGSLSIDNAVLHGFVAT